MDKIDRFDAVYLAVLFHDIGKFKQHYVKEFEEMVRKGVQRSKTLEHRCVSVREVFLSAIEATGG